MIKKGVVIARGFNILSNDHTLYSRYSYIRAFREDPKNAEGAGGWISEVGCMNIEKDYGGEGGMNGRTVKIYFTLNCHVTSKQISIANN